MSFDFNFSNAGRIIDTVSYAIFGTVLFDFFGRGRSEYASLTVGSAVADELSLLLSYERSEYVAAALESSVPKLKETLLRDAEFIYEKDPAASCVDEVILAYPGFYAIFCHRLANILYRNGAELAARFISEYAHSVSGADIHPGASIGERFSIDHATGIVIGETSVIGNGVSIYHGVTIGAKSMPKTVTERGSRMKRHPTVEDGCTIYTGAVVLGRDTVIGRGSVIGAGVRVTAAVPPGTVVLTDVYSKTKI